MIVYFVIGRDENNERSLIDAFRTLRPAQQLKNRLPADDQATIEKYEVKQWPLMRNIKT